VCLLVAAPSFAADAADSVLISLKADADSLRPLVKTKVARAFLDGVRHLPKPSERLLFRDAEGTRYWNEREVTAMSDSIKAILVPRPTPPVFYYQTRYGTPLAYARPLEVLGAAGLTSLSGKRVLDYGYGTIGHLRLLATLGAEVVGVDVDPMLRALYSDPGDQGPFGPEAKHDASVTLVDGSFPGDTKVASAVRDGYTLIMSKNTLKRGYVHPEREVDPRRLVHLGVTDSVFVREVHQRLAPGGWFLIYNLAPAPSKPDEPYKPWADGRCPFPREMLEKAGFEVLAYDQDDSRAARTMARALGWDEGAAKLDLENDLFGLYTLARRKSR
jgi:SAM-dependent methyltransferase